MIKTLRRVTVFLISMPSEFSAEKVLVSFRNCFRKQFLWNFGIDFKLLQLRNSLTRLKLIFSDIADLF